MLFLLCVYVQIDQMHESALIQFEVSTQTSIKSLDPGVIGQEKELDSKLMFFFSACNKKCNKWI